MSEEERRKVLERLVKQMQDAQKGQTPGAAQAAPSQPPAPPSAPPRLLRLRRFPVSYAVPLSPVARYS